MLMYNIIVEVEKTNKMYLLSSTICSITIHQGKYSYSRRFIVKLNVNSVLTSVECITNKVGGA